MSDEKQLIESINWSKLKHAEGSAIDTGADLLALTSSHANERRDAFEVLALTLYQPGKFFSVADSAAKVLVRIATTAKYGRAEALCLLGDLLAADHRSRPSGLDLSDSTLAKEYAKAVPKKLVKLLSESMDELLPLLEVDDPDVRASAAFLCSFVFPQRDVITQRLLTAHAAEPRDASLPRISQLLALGLLAGYGVPEASQAIANNDEAAAWLIRCRTEQVPTNIVSQLLAWPDVAPWRCPWYGGKLSQAIAVVAAHAGPKLKPSLLAALEEGVPEGSALPAILGVFFERVRGVRSVDSLDDEQRRALELLSRDELSSPVFATFGLPMRGASRQAWLGLSEGGILEASTNWTPEGCDAGAPLWQKLKAAEPQKSMGLAESANYYRELAAQIAAADTPELAQRALVATLEREYNLKPAPTEVVAEFFAEHPKSARNVAKELAATWKDTPTDAFLGTLVVSVLGTKGAKESWFAFAGPASVVRAAFQNLSKDARERAFSAGVAANQSSAGRGVVLLFEVVDLTQEPRTHAEQAAKLIRKLGSLGLKKAAKAALKEAAARCPELEPIAAKNR